MARILEKSRYLVLLAVGASLVASAVAFLWGCWKTIQAIVQIVSTAGKDPAATVSQIALMDKFLIATGLYIFAVGMYELFIGELSMPAWLTVHSLHEVKSRLSAIIILVMAIVFLEHLVEWKDPQGTLYFAIAVAAVTVALIALELFRRARLIAPKHSEKSSPAPRPPPDRALSCAQAGDHASRQNGP